ncbi:MAG: type II toxin-antitoxin system RelE/ParE family toxin [Armatimonadota bacterium]
MKSYKIIQQDSAKDDVRRYVDYIIGRENSRVNAERWLAGLLAEIRTLQELPRRCPRIPEQELFEIELRQFVYHSHRVIFHVSEETNVVHVLRIYHGALPELEAWQIKPPG